MLSAPIGKILKGEKKNTKTLFQHWTGWGTTVTTTKESWWLRRSGMRTWGKPKNMKETEMSWRNLTLPWRLPFLWVWVLWRGLKACWTSFDTIRQKYLWLVFISAAYIYIFIYWKNSFHHLGLGTTIVVLHMVNYLAAFRWFFARENFSG